MDDVVVIGGGIIGAATAYFLSKEGRKVKVIERDPTYKTASFPLSLVVLIILIALIIILILRFRRVNMISTYLMIPYLLWCCFALILNSSLIILN